MTLQCATAVIHKKIYRDLVDFDMHLDDISLVRKQIIDINGEQKLCTSFNFRITRMLRSTWK